MNDTNLKKEFREDAIDRFENQMATYYYTLQQYPDHIVYIESICPKKGMPQCGIDFMDEVVVQKFEKREGEASDFYEKGLHVDIDHAHIDDIGEIHGDVVTHPKQF